MVKEALAMGSLIMLTGAIGLKWQLGDGSPEGITWLFGLLIISTLVFYSVVFLGIRITGPGWALDQIERAKEEVFSSRIEVEEIAKLLVELTTIYMVLAKLDQVGHSDKAKIAISKTGEIKKELATLLGIDEKEFMNKWFELLPELELSLKDP